MGWSKHFMGDVDLVNMDGGHLGIFREPAVQTLAEKLTTILEEVTNKSQIHIK